MNDCVLSGLMRKGSSGREVSVFFPQLSCILFLQGSQCNSFLRVSSSTNLPVMVHGHKLACMVVDCSTTSLA